MPTIFYICCIHLLTVNISKITVCDLVSKGMSLNIFTKTSMPDIMKEVKID